MFDTLEKWKTIIESKWWGLVFVYVISAASAYSVIWSLIEPLNTPEKIELFASVIDRRILHIILSVLFGAHLTLLLVVFRTWIKHREHEEIKETPDIHLQSMGVTLRQYSRKISPKRNDLILERVWMKDKKISQSAFASRVLLALNCEVLTETFANELLREVPYTIKAVDKNIYTLIYDNSQVNSGSFTDKENK